MCGGAAGTFCVDGGGRGLRAFAKLRGPRHFFMRGGGRGPLCEWRGGGPRHLL